MNGGIGYLSIAADDIDLRIASEESKKANLESAQKKCEDFMSVVKFTDDCVSSKVAQNQDEFYSVNEWARSSILYAALETWCDRAMQWLNNTYKDGIEYFSHYWSILTESDLSKMSDEDLRGYYNNLKKRIEDNGLSEDDSIRLKALFKYLSRGSFRDKKLYFEVFAMANSDDATCINEYINSKGYSEGKAEWIKYFMSKGTSLTSAEALYEKWSNSSNVIGDMKMLEESSSGGGFKQGNFHIGEFSVSKSSDGSCDLSLSAKQTSAAKSYGAVIVYDAEGHAIDIKVLDRYHNPANAIEACQTIWKDWHGEDYSETKVNVSVPKGGYVQITDDPDEIAIVQTGKIAEEVVSDKVKDILKEEVVEWVKEKTGVGQVGKHATDAVKYRAEVITQAKEGYEIAKKSAEIMDKIEDVYWSAQQKGSGSAILYND